MAPHEAATSHERVSRQKPGQSTHQRAHGLPTSPRWRSARAEEWCAAAWLKAWQWGSVPLAVTVSCLALWGATAAAVGAPAWPPWGQLFSLLLLAGVGAVAAMVAKCARLPELVGPLAAGALLRSLGVVYLQGDYQQVAEVIRKCALAVILIRAGLGLDSAALRRLYAMVLRLAVVPSVVEAGVLIVVSHYLLDLPWIWGALAGTMMAAVSPAVVIPALFRLQEQGYGADKGIPTLVVAAASLDDVIAVTTFGIIYGVIFAGEEDVINSVIRGVFAVPIGVVFGILWGMFLRYVPRFEDEHLAGLRTLLVAGGGLLAVLGSSALGFEGAGPLGAILAAFVAAHFWRNQGWEDHNPVTEHFRLAWVVLQIVLFALIGAEVDVTSLEPMDVALGLATLFLALSARIAITVLVAFGEDFTWKEKLFLSFAWFPKATVQAALGPAALDAVRRLQRTADEPHAQHILTLAALAILLTAPCGAVILAVLGPRLLKRVPPGEEGSPKAEEEESLDKTNEDPRPAGTSDVRPVQRYRSPASGTAADTPLIVLNAGGLSSPVIPFIDKILGEEDRSTNNPMDRGYTNKRWVKIGEDISQDHVLSHM